MSRASKILVGLVLFAGFSFAVYALLNTALNPDHINLSLDPADHGGRTAVRVIIIDVVLGLLVLTVVGLIVSMIVNLVRRDSKNT